MQMKNTVTAYLKIMQLLSFELPVCLDAQVTEIPDQGKDKYPLSPHSKQLLLLAFAGHMHGQDSNTMQV